MDYQEYIKTELLVLIPVLYFIGIGLKKSRLSDKWIPLTLGIISIMLSSIWVLSVSCCNGVEEIAAAVFTSITQGVLVAGASVYANQLYLQSQKTE